MFPHVPGGLKGPITQDRDWWPRTDEASVDLLPAQDEVPSLDDPEIRADLVQRIRREIAAGTYETPEKWQAALDRMLDRLDDSDQ